MRVQPEYDYPKYHGHKASDRHTFQHQLVIFIRLTLIHAISKMTLPAKMNALDFMDPNGSLQSQLRNLSSSAMPPEFDIKPKGAAKLVPAKIFAVPGKLSRDEYFSLPLLFGLADGLESTIQTGNSTELGARWSVLAQILAEVEKNRFLREYDCGKA